MTLKIQLNGTKFKITNPEKPMVAFIDGVKKKLIKGVTFVNGEKKIVWGKTGVRIEIGNMSGFQLSSKQAPMFQIFCGEKFFYASTTAGNSMFTGCLVFKFDVSNIAAGVPYISDLAWGMKATHSFMESTPTALIYYAQVNQYNVASMTWNKLSIDVATENMSIATSQGFTKPGTSGITNPFHLQGAQLTDGYLGYNAAVNFSKWFSNTTFKYDITAVNQLAAWYLPLAKFTANSIIGGSSPGVTPRLQVYQSTGVTSQIICQFVPNSVMTDGTNIAAAGAWGVSGAPVNIYGGFGLWTNGQVLINEFNGSAGNRRTMGLLGKINDFYYVLDIPEFSGTGSSAAIVASDPKCWLRLFKATDGTLYESIELTADMFPTLPASTKFFTVLTSFAGACHCPIVSPNGYLGTLSGGVIPKHLIRIKGY